MRCLLILLSLLSIPFKLLPEGRLIEVCGIDGAGKSTFVQDMKDALIAEGRKVIVLRPISGDPAIYKLLDELDTLKNGTEKTAIQERIDRFKSDYFLLTFLNHKPLIDRLLLEDYDILCDRYLFSFKTYQKCFNQNTDEDEAMLEDLPKADITYFLTVPIDLAMNRIEAKGKPAPYENPVFLENAQETFLRDASLQHNLVHLNGDGTRKSNVENALSVLEKK